MKRLKILIIPLLIITLLGFGMNSFASLHSKWSAGDLIFYDGATDIFTIKDSTDGLMVHDDINLTFGDGSDATIEWDADGTSKLILTCSSGFTLAGGLGFTGDILMATTSKMQFHDVGIYIHASADGAMAISSDGTLAIGATTSYTLTSPTTAIVATTSTTVTTPSFKHARDANDYVTTTIADTGTVLVDVTGDGSGSYEIQTDDEAIVLDAANGITLDSGTGAVTATAALVTQKNNGTANTGVTAVEYGDGYQHISVLTVSQVDALTTADNGIIADGYLLYTFPAGAVVIDYAYMTMGMTATTEQQADTPDVGLGTVIASGATALLGGTGTFENIITGQTAADANNTATVKTALPTAGTPFIIESGDAHTLHFNAADTWADDTSADLTADIAGTVVIVWRFLQ